MFNAYRKSLVIFGVILCLFSTVSANYSGGDGSAENPYQIANPNDLLLLAADTNDYNDCFILVNDINLGNYSFTDAVISPGTDSIYGFQGIRFSGVFDGNGHAISNLTINTASRDFIGLFGSVGRYGQISNLILENVDVNGDNYVGGLTGENDQCAVINCYSTGIVTGREGVGGLVGVNAYSSITNCYSTAAVSGTGKNIGGLVGLNFHFYENIITNSYATGMVSGEDHVGGLVGENDRGNITNCYSTGLVNGNQDSGGLVGYNGGSITSCYATGDVSGYNCVGGLVGIHSVLSKIASCYSTGSVSGNQYVGGLAGYNSGSIINCYGMGTADGNDAVGGLVGSNDYIITGSFWDVNSSGLTTSASGTGKTTVEMQTLSTFTDAGWDFSYTDGNDAVWFIQVDEYPILTWQISPADIYTDGKNNFKDFAIFAKYWMRDDCRIYNDYCDFADLDFSGCVDIDDLIILMTYWLDERVYNYD